MNNKINPTAPIAAINNTLPKMVVPKPAIAKDNFANQLVSDLDANLARIQDNFALISSSGPGSLASVPPSPDVTSAAVVAQLDNIVNPIRLMIAVFIPMVNSSLGKIEQLNKLQALVEDLLEKMNIITSDQVKSQISLDQASMKECADKVAEALENSRKSHLFSGLFSFLSGVIGFVIAFAQQNYVGMAAAAVTMADGLCMALASAILLIDPSLADNSTFGGLLTALSENGIFITPEARAIGMKVLTAVAIVSMNPSTLLMNVDKVVMIIGFIAGIVEMAMGSDEKDDEEKSVFEKVLGYIAPFQNGIFGGGIEDLGKAIKDICNAVHDKDKDTEEWQAIMTMVVKLVSMIAQLTAVIIAGNKGAKEGKLPPDLAEKLDNTKRVVLDIMATISKAGNSVSSGSFEIINAGVYNEMTNVKIAQVLRNIILNSIQSQNNKSIDALVEDQNKKSKEVQAEVESLTQKMGIMRQIILSSAHV